MSELCVFFSRVELSEMINLPIALSCVFPSGKYVKLVTLRASVSKTIGQNNVNGTDVP